MHVHLNFKSFSGIVDSICSNSSFLCRNIEPESSLYHHFVFLSCLFKTSCHHAEKNWDVTYIGIFFVVVMVLGFEFRASCFLGKYSTTWPTSPVLEPVFFLNFYFIHMYIQCLGHFSVLPPHLTYHPCPLPLPHYLLATRQKLFCPYL
jgi:hypothetical protein